MIRREFTLWLECDAPEQPPCAQRSVVSGTDRRDAEKQARWLGWKIAGGACLCPDHAEKFGEVVVKVA